MELQGLASGAKLVTTSGDVVELLAIENNGLSARVRYVEAMDPTLTGKEDALPSDDIVTVAGPRFVSRI